MNAYLIENRFELITINLLNNVYSICVWIELLTFYYLRQIAKD